MEMYSNSIERGDNSGNTSITKNKRDFFHWKKVLLCVAVILMFVLSVIYVGKCTVNVPFMDYYEYFKDTALKVLNGTAQFSDFWQQSMQHKTPLLRLLLVLNIKLFNWNTMVSVYAGQVVILFTVILLYSWWKDVALCKHSFFLFMLTALYLFCFGQWEITTNEFSFSFMLRIFSYIGILISCDRIFHLQSKLSRKRTVIIGCVSAIVFLTISQVYFAGILAAVGAASVFHFVSNFRQNKFRELPAYLILIGCMLTATALYMYGVDLHEGTGNVSNNNTFNVLNDILLSGTFVKGIIVMLGASLYQSDSVTKTIYILGGGYAILLIVIITVYFVRRLYKKSYLPIMLLIYSFVNIALVIYGRYYRFGVDGLCASRYVVETKLIAVAVIGIIAMLLSERQGSRRIGKIQKSSALICVILLFCTILASNARQLRIAPYRKEYHQNAVNSLINVDLLDDEQLQINQAKSAENFRIVAEAMKKYRLGVFNKMPSSLSGSEISESIYVSGVSGDGWIEDKATFVLRSGQGGVLRLSVYNPFDEQNTSRITINEETHEIHIIPGEAAYSIDVPIDEVINVTIDNSDFARQRSEEDTRRLSFILSELSVE